MRLVAAVYFAQSEENPPFPVGTDGFQNKTVWRGELPEVGS